MPRQARAARTRRLPILVLLGLLVLVAVVLLARERALPQPQPGTSTATWDVAFTTPVIPDDPARHTGGLDARLVALMDSATSTLDVASYDFDLANVAQAMARAAGRGVQVRMVTDTDTVQNTRDQHIQTALKIVREAGIPIVQDERQPIMHHKFTVVDGQTVQTGSWNYTDGDTYRLNNNLAVFRSRELAENYTAEFEKMHQQRRFGPSKSRGVPHSSIDLDGISLQNLFAPQDRVGDRLVELVSRAQRRVHFLAFSFTHDRLGQAMMDRARAGLEVQGVFERTGSSTQFSEFGRMKEAGLDVYQDGSPYAMHHKVILLDDSVTVFGSFNFSNNADQDNDENLLIVEGAQFASPFEREFQRMLTLAKNPAARK